MSLLPTQIIKNSQIVAGIYFNFVKKVLDLTLQIFISKLGPH